jgi:hypothetical protein
VTKATEVLAKIKANPDADVSQDMAFFDSDDIDSHVDFQSFLEFMAGMDADKALQSFLDAWDGSCGRDVGFRSDPDDSTKRLWVAGDMSWGNEPDGFGFQAAKEALMLGMLEPLGVS